MNRYSAYGMIYSSAFLGTISLLTFYVFLFTGALNIVDFGFGDKEVLFIDTCLSLIFFVQHSIMVRKPFRQTVLKVIPGKYYMAFYAIISGATLLLMMVLWQESALSFGTTTGIYRWGLRLLFFSSCTGFIWCVHSLGGLDISGKKGILSDLNNTTPPKTVFTIKGPYRWMRHPIYFFVLVMIWSLPALTADRLLFNILWTIWIVLGARMEEGDLVNEFGDAYRNYQKNVPMIVPVKLSEDYYKNSNPN